MALILIRAEDQAKLLNTLADIERHAGLKVTGKPRIINSRKADEIASKILKQEVRSKSDIAVLVHVEDVLPLVDLGALIDHHDPFRLVLAGHPRDAAAHRGARHIARQGGCRSRQCPGLRHFRCSDMRLRPQPWRASALRRALSAHIQNRPAPRNPAASGGP